MGLKDFLPEKALPFCGRVKLCSFCIKYQSEFLQKLFDCFFPLPQLSLAVGKQDIIIDVAHVTFATQHLFNVVIEKAEVVVGKKLAGQVTDRQPFSPFMRSKEGVARKIVDMLSLNVAVVDDGVDQPQGISAPYFSAKQRFEYFVIDGGKIFPDITLQHISTPCQVVLVAPYGLVCSLGRSVGVGIKNKAPLKQRADNIDQGMMHNAVFERSCADHSWFWLVDAEGFV